MGDKYSCDECDNAVVLPHVSTAPEPICPDCNLEMGWEGEVETGWDMSVGGFRLQQ